MGEAINGALLLIVLVAFTYAVLIARSPRQLRLIATSLAAMADALDELSRVYKERKAQFRESLKV